MLGHAPASDGNVEERRGFVLLGEHEPGWMRAEHALGHGTGEVRGIIFLADMNGDDPLEAIVQEASQQ